MEGGVGRAGQGRRWAVYRRIHSTYEGEDGVENQRNRGLLRVVQREKLPWRAAPFLE